MIHILEQVSQTSDITTKESSVRESWVMMQTRCTSVSELVFYFNLFLAEDCVKIFKFMSNRKAIIDVE